MNNEQQSGNRYTVNDPMPEASSAPRSYSVADDEDTANAGFSEIDKEQKKILDEVDKLSMTKNQYVALVLDLLPGFSYFYVGRVKEGILRLLTANFFFVGMVIDLFVIGMGKFKDKDGKYLNLPKLAYYNQKMKDLNRAAKEMEDFHAQMDRENNGGH